MVTVIHVSYSNRVLLDATQCVEVGIWWQIHSNTLVAEEDMVGGRM